MKLTEKQSRLWLAAIILLGAALRLHGLGERSFWYDEVESMGTALASWSDFWAVARGRHQAPPLDFLLMRPFVAWGDGEVAGRLWSALASILCIPVIYAWGRDLAGRSVGLIAALLMATSAFAVAYAQEARMYSSFLLFTLLSFWALARLQTQPSRKRALIYGLSLGAVLLTHYYAYWVVMLQAPWLLAGLLFDPKQPRRWGLLIVAWGVGAASFLPWLPTFLEDLRSTSGAVSWGLPFNAESFSSLLKLYCSGRNTPWLFVPAAFFAGYAARRQDRPDIRWVASIALAALVLPLLQSHFKPTASARYLIFFLAPFYLAVAAGLTWAAERFRHGLPVAAVVILVGLVPATLRDKDRGINAWKPRWRDAAVHINAGDPTLPVAVSDWTAGIVMGYYLRPYENHFSPRRTPPPPAQYRVQILDEKIVHAIEAGHWKGWVVTHFGVNRNPASDALVARVRAVAGAPMLHLPSPNESNGVDVLAPGVKP